MGVCISKQNKILEQVELPPHLTARKMWLVAVPLDSQQIPLDLAGIDHDGLKSAMKNRGMETEHWALKVDLSAQEKGYGTVFDINVEGNKMVTSTGDVNSPYWRAISRRVPLGWTLWTNNEISSAIRQLIQARPKYNGRTNNLQQLAQFLAKHIEYKPPTAAEDSSSSPGASKAGLPSLSSQLTDLSGQLSDSNESSGQLKDSQQVTANAASVASSVRNSGSKRHSRPSVAHRASSSISERDDAERPSLIRSPMSEQQASRLQASRDRSSQQRPSPLNPEKHRSMTGPLIDLGHPSRTRSQSDVSHWNQSSVYDSTRRRKSMLASPKEGRRKSTYGQSKRRSQAPMEWVGDHAAARTPRADTRSKRESQPLFVPTMPSATWGPSHAPPSLASPYEMGMLGLPPVQPWAYNVGPSSSMTSLHRPMLPHPPSFYGPPSVGMPWMTPMPMLVPPSPGYGSMQSSLVPTPPESPHLMPTQTKPRQISTR